MTHPAFSLPIRVYYEDTDAGGIVYYANYLKFAERGRTEWLRHLGLQSSELRESCGILIVVKTVEIDYKRPALLDDSLILTTQLLDLGATSMTLSQIVRRDEAEICCMKVVLVCVGDQNHRPTRWPEAVRTALGLPR